MLKNSAFFWTFINSAVLSIVSYLFGARIINKLKAWEFKINDHVLSCSAAGM